MGIYFSMKSESGRVIINRYKIITLPLKIFEEILNHPMEFDKEYTIDGKNLEKILEYYANIVNPMQKGWIRNSLINCVCYPLLNEVESDKKEKKYIIKLD